ncbi:MAG TPA: hypothetical protein VLE69_01375 [Candidatus Saccharimonadales bacterium]|nr:hypothetical protein [Candidatus Saccharimonadales bacterium]
MEHVSGSHIEGLYQPRAGEYLEHFIDILSSPPDRELTHEQKQAFIEFENGLMAGVASEFSQSQHSFKLEGEELPLNELEDQTSYSQERAQLSLDYFLTEAGQDDLTRLNILDSPVLDKVELAKLIRSKAIYVPKEDLKKLQVDSEEYVDNQIVEAIAEGREIESPERIVVFSDGTKLVRRAKGMWAYKDFLKTVNRELSQDKDAPNNLLAAKQSVLRMYRRKVNSFLAGLEPDLLDFWRQLEAMEDDHHKAVLQETVSMVWPPIDRVDTDQNSPSMKRFIVRLDRIRNGVSLDDRSKYTAISRELEDFFANKKQDPETEIPQPVFSSKEISALDDIFFDADDMQAFCKFLLEAVGKLSDEPDESYDPDRPTRAKDGKWQVPIRKDVKSMSAEDPPGALSIPIKFKRSLTKSTPPVGVIPGSLHEIMHIFQNDNYRNNTRGLKLGQLMKGKRSIVLREAGALDIERRVQQRLFGRQRPNNAHHLRAIKALENGGTEIDAIKAFFDSYKHSSPEATLKSAAAAAVRGVKRTARRKGGFDSQALNYAESTLVFLSAQNLNEETRNLIFGEGAFGLDDLCELHRFGLLDKSAAQTYPLDELLSQTVEYMRKILNQDMDKQKK